MARLIRTDGTEAHIEPADKLAGFSLQELYDHIGGGCDIIQVVPVGKHGIICDEEGKCREPQQARNVRATAEFGRFLLPGDVLVGNIIVLESDNELQ